MVNNKLKHGIGDLLLLLLPQKAARLAEKGMTITDEEVFSKVDYLLRDALLRKAELHQNFEVLAKFHHDYWTHQGSQFFSKEQHKFSDFFHSDCTFIFDALIEKLANNKQHFNTLVEVGTGNGEVLQYLSSKFPAIEHLIGIDLSTEQIAINTERFAKEPKLRFVASDGLEWVKAHGQEYSIFVTSGGVLEYFTEVRLQEFLLALKEIGKVIFVAIEPKGRNHDFTVNPNSEPYGQERSFSHNYHKNFKNAGFTIWHSSEKAYAKNKALDFSFTGASYLNESSLAL